MVDDIRTLQELAYSQPRLGPISTLDDSIRSSAKATGRRLWQGLLAVAATGFGKGVLLAATVLVASTAVYFGASAAGGALFHTVGATGAWLPSTLEQGIAHGISEGFGLLTKGWGLLALGIGGALGAVSDVRKRQGQVTAEIAQAEALQYELLRRQQPQQAMEPQRAPQPAQLPQPSQPTVHVSYNPAATAVHHNQLDANFAERERQRRAEGQTTPAVGK